MRISDWSSDVCSSDLGHTAAAPAARNPGRLSRSGPVARVLAAGPLRGDSVMLPPWVSHCELDDQMIFLDVRRNRYWAMSAETISEERRVGKECVRTCRTRWTPVH